MSLMVTNESRLEGVVLTELHADPDTLTITYKFVADHGAWFSPSDPLSGPDGWVRGLEKITGDGKFIASTPEQHHRDHALMAEWVTFGDELRLGSDVDAQATALWQPDTVPLRTVSARMPEHLMDRPPLRAAA